MKGIIFPGQGSQFEGMGQKLLEADASNQLMMEQADEALGFKLSEVMIHGDAEALRQTNVTQPAVFLYSLLKYYNNGSPDASAMAGHSLGEITALVAIDCISFVDGLQLVLARANAMQAACVAVPGTMAAVLGLEDEQVVDICESVSDVVIAANFNCPGQIVISGTTDGVAKASEACSEAGARRVLPLSVGGAFHSELMQPAKDALALKIESITFKEPKCKVYQNLDAQSSIDATQIQKKLLEQLTSPVQWTEIMKNMHTDGITAFEEYGAKVLSGFFKRYDRSIVVENFQ